MFRPLMTARRLLALSGFGLLFVGGPTQAQQGWPLLGDNWSYHWGQGGSRSSFGGYSRPYRPVYENAMPPIAGNYGLAPGAYYYGPGSYGSSNSAGYYGVAAERPARFNLRVPADARVWFDQSQTDQTGTFRSFVSPPLASGREYTYAIRVQWKRDSKDVTQTRKVTFHAGELVSLAVPADSAPGR
jgi:uncharacterized protein (TIGR03000 family)